jgi:cellulose synthase/poly-beta-1,6-N-acetylglucosamine synthase-like glycosyltransferase
MQVDSRMIALVIVISLYVVCSAVLLAFGAQCYILTFLFLRKRRQRVTTQRETMKYYYTTTDETLYPKVVTQLPMYNEKQVACRVIEAAAAMDYPRSRHEIQILDDSTDETVTYVDAMVKKIQGAGIQHIRYPPGRRPDRF